MANMSQAQPDLKRKL